MRMEQPFKVRTWYGMPAEILVGRTWHWVKALGVPLPHPGLVDIHLRRSIPRREAEQLTYWHELGHLETMPLALLHLWTLWRTGRKRRNVPRTLKFLIGLLAWLAGWELTAEFYVMARAGPEYARLYRRTRTPLPLDVLFWVGMGLLTFVGTAWMLGGRRPDECANA